MIYGKTVKTKADLNALALETGASVAGDKGKFNVEKRQALKPKRLEKDPDAMQIQKAPVPAPESAPPVPDPGSVLVAEKIDASSKATVMMLAELKKQMAEIQMHSPELITDWDFKFIRDDEGVLTNLLAHGTVPVKVLN